MVERSFVKIELLMLLCSLYKHIIDYQVTAFLWHIADDVATEGKKVICRSSYFAFQNARRAQCSHLFSH